MPIFIMKTSVCVFPGPLCVLQVYTSALVTLFGSDSPKYSVTKHSLLYLIIGTVLATGEDRGECP